MGRQATAWRYNDKGRGGGGRNGPPKTKEKEYKFATQEQIAQGNYYGTYDSIKDNIITEVQKVFEYGCDIATSIRDGKRFDLDAEEPKRKESIKTDDAARMLEQGGFDIRYQETLRVHLERDKHLRENEKKTYSLIISDFCTKQMKTRIEEHPEYAKIVDDPIKLLHEIKTLTHDTVRAQYPIASITDHMARWLNTKQHKDEGLSDYIKRAKYNRDIVKIHFGNKILHSYVKTTKEYKDLGTDLATATERKELCDNSFEQLSAYVMMRGSDSAKYGSMMKGFVSQFLMKNDQYPKTMADAMDVMSKHQFDEKYYDRQKKNRDRNKQRNDDDDKKPKVETNLYQKKDGFACYCCGKKDHDASKCPERESRSRDKWYANKAITKVHQHM